MIPLLSSDKSSTLEHSTTKAKHHAASSIKYSPLLNRLVSQPLQEPIVEDENDQLAIAKETERRLGMGTNMYPSSWLLGQHKDQSLSALSFEELIENVDGFAGVFPEHKYEIVKKLQARKLICIMTGDVVDDVPALKKDDIGIVVADATEAAQSASDIVLTEPGLSVIISVVLTSRVIFQRMKNYTFGVMLIALI